MESWSYALEGGFSVSDIGLELPVDTLKRGRTLLNERNLIPFCSEGEFMESGVTDMLWNSPVSSSSADRDDDLIKMLSSDQADRDDDLIKMLSSDQSVKFTGYGEFKNRQSSKVLPSKRPRTTNLQHYIPVQVHDYKEMKRSQYSLTSVTNFSSEVPVCQVHGCNRDLRSSKHYHKKHKVCDEHSKAAQVTVNGTEQRFCQQCSRFHLVAEFDDNKRSCRMRLAEHNERRRKPHNEIHWGAAARLLDMASQRVPMSFHFPEELSQSYFCHEIYGNKSSCQIEFTEKQSNAHTNGNQHDDTRKQISMENIMQTLSAEGEKSRRAFSLLPAAPTSGNLGGYIKADRDFIKPFGIITSNSLTLHDCNAPGIIQVHNEGNFKESGPILDLQQLSALLQRVQQQQRNSAQMNQELSSF